MLADRIKVTTATTGTGALTLSATGVRDAVNGDCIAPAENLGDLASQVLPYFIVSGNKFGSGFGSLSADGLTLTRDPSEMSWDTTTYSQALLSLTGTSTVFITPRSVDLVSASSGLTRLLAIGFTTF